MRKNMYCDVKQDLQHIYGWVLECFNGHKIWLLHPKDVLNSYFSEYIVTYSLILYSITLDLDLARCVVQYYADIAHRHLYSRWHLIQVVN